MSLLVVIETRDLTHVFFVPVFLFTLTDLGLVDSKGWGGRIFGFLRIFLVSMMPLFLILSSLIGKLELLNRNEGLKSLGVISAACALHLDLVRSGVNRLTSLEDLEISLSHIRTRL